MTQSIRSILFRPLSLFKFLDCTDFSSIKTPNQYSKFQPLLWKDLNDQKTNVSTLGRSVVSGRRRDLPNPKPTERMAEKASKLLVRRRKQIATEIASTKMSKLPGWTHEQVALGVKLELEMVIRPTEYSSDYADFVKETKAARVARHLAKMQAKIQRKKVGTRVLQRPASIRFGSVMYVSFLITSFCSYAPRSSGSREVLNANPGSKFIHNAMTLPPRVLRSGRKY
jgi:hypothetical protein